LAVVVHVGAVHADVVVAFAEELGDFADGAELAVFEQLQDGLAGSADTMG
jgi:hypothetical protein